MAGASEGIGLALGAGGARALAHIGVLKVLEQEGIPIGYLAGTSMGGAIAAGYATGLDLAFMEQEARRMADPRHLLALCDSSPSRAALFEGEKVHAFVAGYLGDCSFDDASPTLALVAVDLVAGQEVILRKGSVVDAVRAAVALPGLVMPAERDGQQLVDGCLLDSVPAGAARHMGAKVVVAVDVGTEGATGGSLVQMLMRSQDALKQRVDTVQVLHRSLEVVMADINRRRLEEAHPEVIIRPAIPPEVTVLTGLAHVGDLIAIGEDAARAALPRIDLARQQEAAGGL